MKSIASSLLKTIFIITPMVRCRLSSPDDQNHGHRKLQSIKMSWPECFVVTPPLSATDCKALIDKDLPALNLSIENVIIVNPLGENNIHIPTGPDGIVHRPVHYWRSENFGGSAPFQWDCTGMQGVECCTMVQKDAPQMTCHIDQPSGQDKSNLIDKPNRVYICADHSGLVSEVPVVDPPPGPICPTIKNPTG